MELGRHKGTKASSAQSGKLCVFVSLCSVKIIPSYYLIITKKDAPAWMHPPNIITCSGISLEIIPESGSGTPR